MKPINLLKFKIKKVKKEFGYISTSMFTKKEIVELRKMNLMKRRIDG